MPNALKNLVTNLVLAPSELAKPDMNDSVAIYELEITQYSLIHAEKTIRTLTLIHSMAKQQNQMEPQKINCTRFRIEYMNKEVAWCYLPKIKINTKIPDQEFVTAMNTLFSITKLFMQCGAVKYYSHAEVGVTSNEVGMIGWDTLSTTVGYAPNERAQYSRLHKHVADLLARLIESSEQDKKLTIALGCGDGRDLHQVVESIGGKGIGIDFNSSNIQNATRAYPEYKFFEGNVLSCYDMLVKQRDVAGVDDSWSFNVICVGLLARKVLNGSYEALFVLQQCYSAGVINLVATSYTACLVVPHCAQACGWEIACTEFEGDPSNTNELGRGSVVASLRRMPEAKYLDYILERSSARSRASKITTLDLSFSTNPHRLLEILVDHHINILQNVITIDISWAYLPLNKVDIFLETLRSLPEIRNILFVVHAGFNTAICNSFKKSGLTVLQRIDIRHPLEIPVFSVADCRGMGLFNNLPYKPYFSPKKPSYSLKSSNKDKTKAVETEQPSKMTSNVDPVSGLRKGFLNN